MVQIINDPYKGGSSNIFGRIGSSFGKGVAEQAPKEMEHARLSQGLKQLGEESPNLSPIEFLTKAYSTYGITPQMVQSLGEAAKFQRQKGALARRAGNQNQPSSNQFQENTQNQPSFQDQKSSQNAPEQIQQRNGTNPQGRNLLQGAKGQEGIVNTNPIRERALPGIPSTPEQIANRVSQLLDSGEVDDVNQGYALARQEEQQRLSLPLAEQERDNYLEEVKQKTRDQFDKELQTVFQTDKNGIFKDITGDNLIKLYEGLERDIRANPNVSKDKIIKNWREKAQQFARTKNSLKELANQNILAKPFNIKNNSRSLDTFQKIFKDANQLEEFYNILRSKDLPPEIKEGQEVSPGFKGFGMSNQGAAYKAFPTSEEVKKQYTKIPRSTVKNMYENAYAAAEQIAPYLKKDDSILAIMKDLTLRDPFFDQSGFLKYFNENFDSLPLSDRHKSEISLPPQKVAPDWGDIFYIEKG